MQRVFRDGRKLDRSPAFAKCFLFSTQRSVDDPQTSKPGSRVRPCDNLCLLGCAGSSKGRLCGRGVSFHAGNYADPKITAELIVILESILFGQCCHSTMGRHSVACPQREKKTQSLNLVVCGPQRILTRIFSISLCNVRVSARRSTFIVARCIRTKTLLG